MNIKVCTFRIKADLWEDFRVLCRVQEKTPSDVLREAVQNMVSGYRAVRSEETRMFDGDMSTWLVRNIPELTPELLRQVAFFLTEVAEELEAKQKPMRGRLV